MQPPREPEPIEYPADRVYRLLLARLEAGEWEPGQRIPSVSALASQIGARFAAGA
jgi:DNA-binding FadR family transcriptional regulator